MLLPFTPARPDLHIRLLSPILKVSFDTGYTHQRRPRGREIGGFNSSIFNLWVRLAWESSVHPTVPFHNFFLYCHGRREGLVLTTGYWGNPAYFQEVFHYTACISLPASFRLRHNRSDLSGNSLTTIPDDIFSDMSALKEL